MANRTLRVLARGVAKVPDYAAHAAGATTRFIGWQHDPSGGHEYSVVEGGVSETRKSGHHEAKDEPTVLTFALSDGLFGEYLRCLRDGDLWPADAATAALAGVPFDPTFGGEYAPAVTEKGSA
jgi:hypothetical protein